MDFNSIYGDLPQQNQVGFESMPEGVQPQVQQNMDLGLKGTLIRTRPEYNLN